MNTFTKTGKRDAVADEIERGDHDAPGDQSQLDMARAYIGSEVRRAATPQHDVYVSVSGHHQDEGIDPARQYRHIVIEIRASPDPPATSSALGLNNKPLNVPGLTTETVQAVETVRTNTPHLITDEQPKITDEQPKEEGGAGDNTEVKTDGTEASPADEAHTDGPDHLVGDSETTTPDETVADHQETDHQTGEG